MSFPIYATRAGFACLVAMLATGEAAAQAPQSLTLQQAFTRAVEDAPALKAADQVRLGAEAGVRQAELRTNPTLDITAENFAGGDRYQSFDRAETTFSLSQKLEWGGGRTARTNLAQAEVAAARAGADVRRQELMYQVELAYISAQRTSAEVQVAAERVELAKEIAGTVERRVQAARDPLMAGTRAQTLLTEAEIGLEVARRADEAAKAKLASFWGGTRDFAVDLATFDAIVPRPVDASANPELASAAAAEARAAASIEVERARGRQDPTVSGGLRYFHESDEATLVVGFTIPLPFWDNNTSAVSRAEAERSRLRFETEALRRNLQREANSARAQMDIARAEIEAIDQRLLPSAEQALSQARQGYAAGGFSYLDVLEAQRIVVNARMQRISALVTFNSARVALARLTGAYAGGGTAQ